VTLRQITVRNLATVICLASKSVLLAEGVAIIGSSLEMLELVDLNQNIRVVFDAGDQAWMRSSFLFGMRPSFIGTKTLAF
jgi:hypothetical protein